MKPQRDPPSYFSMPLTTDDSNLQIEYADQSPKKLIDLVNVRNHRISSSGAKRLRRSRSPGVSRGDWSEYLKVRNEVFSLPFLRAARKEGGRPSTSPGACGRSIVSVQDLGRNQAASTMSRLRNGLAKRGSLPSRRFAIRLIAGPRLYAYLRQRLGLGHPEKQRCLPRSSWPTCKMEFVASVSHELAHSFGNQSVRPPTIFVDGLVSRKEELQRYGSVIRKPKPPNH